MSTESKTNVISLKGSENKRLLKLTGKHRVYYDHCLHQTTEFLGVALSAMLDKVDDVMFELANKAENSQDQNLYFDTMRSVRLHRNKIEQDYLETLKRGFQSPYSDNTIDLGEVAGPNLSLIDQDTLEEDLAITNMVSKLQNLCHAAVYELDKRFGYLLDDPELKNHVNPLRPEALCQSFKVSINKLDSDIRTRLLIYKLYDKYVVNEIGQMYTLINRYLVEKQILPIIRMEAVRRPHTTSRSESQVSSTSPEIHSDANGYPSPYPGVQSGYPAPTQDHAGAFINQGLAGTFKQYLSGRPEAVALSPQQILQTPLYSGLSQLQQGHLPASLAESTLDLSDVATGSVNVLRSLRPIASEESDNPADEQTIELVALIFDFILEDKNIDARMKAEIGRLQIPILKVALLDKSLFARKTHPARQLLNRLANVALSWNGNDGNQDDLFEQVHKTVEHIITEFDDSTEIFANLDKELAEYQQSMQKQASVRAERCAKVIEGRERLESAARAAESCCRRYIVDEYQLPDFIITFVARYWKEVLRMIYVREGEDSELWQNAEATLETLCWNFDNRPTPTQAHEFVRRLPESVKSLRTGLDLVSMPNEERDEFFDKLAAWHSRLVKQAATLKASPDIGKSEGEKDSSSELQSAIHTGNAADPDEADQSPVTGLKSDAVVAAEEVSAEAISIDEELPLNGMAPEAAASLASEEVSAEAVSIDEDLPLDATLPESTTTLVSEEVSTEAVSPSEDLLLDGTVPETAAALANEEIPAEAVSPNEDLLLDGTVPETAAALANEEIPAEAVSLGEDLLLDATLPESTATLVSEEVSAEAVSLGEDQPLDSTLPEPAALVATEEVAAEAISLNEDTLLDATVPDLIEENTAEQLATEDHKQATDDIESSEVPSQDDDKLALIDSDDVQSDMKVAKEAASAVDFNLDGLEDSLPELDVAVEALAQQPESDEFESTVDKETLKSFFGTDDMDIEEVVLEDHEHDIESDDPLPRIEVRDQQEQDEFFFMASRLKLGHWVELQREDERTIRARLTWISQSTGTLLFTDRQGRKVAEKTVPGLAAEFKRGAARVLANAPLFDRAISSLVERFQKSEAAAPAG